MIGQMVSQYRILQTLSAAGMTFVSRATDTKFGKFVGLKTFLEEFCMDGKPAEYPKPPAMATLSDAVRWKRVEKIFHEAMELLPQGREFFLEHACGDDVALRKEVDALLRAHEDAGTFLGPSESYIVSHPLPPDFPHRLGPYEILASIGAGGMGQVYRARDSRLGREVALKVLPAELAADPERRERFEREARTVALLNHPNIIAVYDVGAENGFSYIVTELVDGRTLRGAKLGVRNIIDAAIQLANGLAAAHAAAIVHRDLKPDNILLTRDGRIKILDFGLAKISQRPSSVEGLPNTAEAISHPGTVMGTVGYMSPEQLRGLPVDFRSDIFSFGITLHEMFTGSPPFAGNSAADIMASVLRDDPPELPDTVPAAVRQIVAYCLDKNPANRFQSAHDVSLALSAISRSMCYVRRQVPPDVSHST
jgi:predicted Ser/Thr protein kinase